MRKKSKKENIPETIDEACTLYISNKTFLPIALKGFGDIIDGIKATINANARDNKSHENCLKCLIAYLEWMLTIEHARNQEQIRREKVINFNIVKSLKTEAGGADHD